MAVDDAIGGSEEARYNEKITGLVLLSCVIAASGGLLFGYDTGITGGVTSMEPFLKKFFPGVYSKMEDDTNISNYCKFDSQLLTSFSSSIYISGFIASFFASSVTRDYGRKPSIIIGGTAFLAGAAVGGAALNIFMLIFGRLLIGVGVGFANQSVPLYLSEMAPPTYRGAFNSGFQICISTGTLTAFIVNYFTEKIKRHWGWRISLSTAAIPALILALGSLLLPETPNSLLQQGHDHAQAKTILQKIRGTENVDIEFNDLITASEASKTVKNPFKRILQRRYRPQLVMSIAIPFFQQVTGITVISFYAPILFRTIGFSESNSLLNAVITSVAGTGSGILSMFLIDKFGRRVIFHIGGVQMFVTQMVIGGIMVAKLGDQGELSQGYSILVVILIYMYVAGFGFSWGPLGWLITSEIFPLEVRSAAQSIAVGVSFFSSFVMGQMFLAILCRLKAFTFLFFGVWVAVMTGFVYLLLPETKNIPIENMEKIWRGHWFWKRFVADDGKKCEGNSIKEPLLY